VPVRARPGDVAFFPESNIHFGVENTTEAIRYAVFMLVTDTSEGKADPSLDADQQLFQWQYAVRGLRPSAPTRLARVRASRRWWTTDNAARRWTDSTTQTKRRRESCSERKKILEAYFTESKGELLQAIRDRIEKARKVKEREQKAKAREEAKAGPKAEAKVNFKEEKDAAARATAAVVKRKKRRADTTQLHRCRRESARAARGERDSEAQAANRQFDQAARE
jgi:hypothetical protein